jgi:UDP-N-acetylglucosamine 2-epimerase (non-hydrolysing)
MAPVVKVLQEVSWATCRVLATAQHRELLDQMLGFFGISSDADLDIMSADQSLPDLTARLIVQLDRALEREAPDLVLAQGDTTTVFTAALASFYRGIPFGHVEAGLRTHNLRSPFPEEAMRVMTAYLTALHLAPTESARQNLLREGIADEKIHVTGNPVIDALFVTLQRNVPIGVELDPLKRLILITAHRRESFGQPLCQICRAVERLCERYADVEFLWPLHPNPSVGPVVESRLGRNARIHLCETLSYGSFVSAMRKAHLILTDSGGVQEEAPALGKPVLVMREESERPEALQAGVALLVGPHEDRIVAETSRLLDDPSAYARMAVGSSPYGDGAAAGRIVEAVQNYLGVPAEPSSSMLSP